MSSRSLDGPAGNGPQAGDRSYVIRPSMLSSYTDCSRRVIARAYPALVEDAGYVLREVPRHCGAAVGTGVHAGAAWTLQQIVDIAPTWLGREETAIERAVEAFRREAAEGVAWDDCTTRATVAEQQIGRMVKEYRRTVAPKVRPAMVERRIEADAGDGFTLSGQPDGVSLEPSAIRDLKTGQHQTVNMTQLGAYALLRRSHGFPVERTVEDYIKRVGLRSPQPAAIEVEYPVDVAERVALRRVQVVKRDLAEFLESGDPLVFPANPASQLCSDRFCPAWGTQWCQEHKRT